MPAHINLSLRITLLLFGLELLPAVTSAAGLPREILLWPNGAPGSEGKTGDEQVRIADNGELHPIRCGGKREVLGRDAPTCGDDEEEGRQESSRAIAIHNGMALAEQQERR